MERISKQLKRTLILLGLLLITTVGLTIAYYNSQKEFKNEFHVGKPGVSVYEDFNPADKWVPDEEKGKQAWFANVGEQDMLLRFTIEAKWIKPPVRIGEDGEPVTDSDGQPEYVFQPGTKVDIDKDLLLYWQDSQNDPAKGYHQTGIDNEVKDSSGNIIGPITLQDAVKHSEFDFEKIGDYYYYKKVLKAQGDKDSQDKTQHILESVKFTEEFANDGHKNSDYSNTQIDLTIKGETVLVDPRAVEEQWPSVKIDTDENGEIKYTTDKNGIKWISWSSR